MSDQNGDSRAELNFDDLFPQEVKVKIGGKPYVLKEASAGAAAQWRNALIGCTQLGPDGKPQSIKGVGDTEPLLVSLCLFESGEKGLIPVPIHIVRGMPARVCKALFEKVKAMSDLDEQGGETEEALVEKMDRLRDQLEKARQGKAEDPLKNAPSGGTPT